MLVLIKNNSVLLLMLATLVLFVSKSLYNIPMGVMALVGLVLLVKNPRSICGDKLFQIYTVLFFCIWAPMLIALVDSVHHQRSSQTVFSYLRFLFIGVFVLYAVRNTDVLRNLGMGISVVIAFWCVDGLIQYITGVNLFGYPYGPGYVTGAFHPEITIGHVTAVMSPVYFDWIRMQSKRSRWAWILIAPLFLVILLSGRRAAWIMLALSCAGYSIYCLRVLPQSKRILRNMAVIGVTVIIVMGLVIKNDSYMQKRIDTTMDLFSGDYEKMNQATAMRFATWEPALGMFRDNWVNGIGPRAYRYVYQQYSEPENIFHEQGQTHPHQLLLEILAETGAIGLAGYLAFLFFLYRLLRKTGAGLYVLPCGLAVVIAMFPANTHMAFYASYWSSIFWWLLAMLFIAARSLDIEKSGQM